MWKQGRKNEKMKANEETGGGGVTVRRKEKWEWKIKAGAAWRRDHG